jgi:hypothetical protein
MPENGGIAAAHSRRIARRLHALSRTWSPVTRSRIAFAIRDDRRLRQ